MSVRSWSTPCRGPQSPQTRSVAVSASTAQKVLAQWRPPARDVRWLWLSYLLPVEYQSQMVALEREYRYMECFPRDAYDQRPWRVMPSEELLAARFAAEVVQVEQRYQQALNYNRGRAQREWELQRQWCQTMMWAMVCAPRLFWTSRAGFPFPVRQVSILKEATVSHPGYVQWEVDVPAGISYPQNAQHPVYHVMRWDTKNLHFTCSWTRETQRWAQEGRALGPMVVTEQMGAELVQAWDVQKWLGEQPWLVRDLVSVVMLFLAGGLFREPASASRKRRRVKD